MKPEEKFVLTNLIYELSEYVKLDGKMTLKEVGRVHYALMASQLIIEKEVKTQLKGAN
jgi:hypothetical protein